MLPVLALHFAVAAGAPWVFARWGRAAFLGLAAVPALSLVWLLGQHGAAYGPGLTEAYPFIPQLGVGLAFRLDPLSWTMSLLILGIGALVLVYCTRYFPRGEADIGGFGGQMLAFAGAMFGLVTADDLIVLFVFWELTTVLSYLLIGFARTRLSARRSALQALVVTTAGGLAMLVGLILLGESAGTYRISELLERAPALAEAPATAAPIAVGALLALVGALSKSALIPFHFWLPAAMAAPTPVSAYLHAAAMVKAGVYLVALLAPALAGTAFWHPIVLGAGLATMLLGGYRALRQTDIKLILAFGTVSQLGFLVAVVGLGTPAAALAGLAMVVAHALFKAALFLVVGIIDHQTGTRDVRRLSGVFRQSRALGITAALAAASMAGVPLFGGFVAKEAVFDAFARLAPGGPDAAAAPDAAGWAAGWVLLVLAAMALGSALTVAYSARFVWGAFARKPGVEDTPFTPITPLFVAPPAILAVLGLAYGLLPAPVDALAAPYAAAVAQTAGALAGADDAGAAAGAIPHLAVWHGLGLPLALSAAGWLTGAALFAAREAVGRAQDRLGAPVDSERVYRSVVGAVDDVAIWITGRTQRGSLFFYLAVILAVAALVPVGAMLTLRMPLPEAVDLVDPGSPLQLVIGIGIALGALAAVRANKRFLAVLMVAVTGYGISLIFALQGAPDLALTQMLVETIVLVAFVLGMRSLPPQLRDRMGGKYRVVRIAIALLFGTAMVFVGLYAMGARAAEPIALRFPELAYQGGGGLNVVNVTLVDIRAWDTFGEISVLALAATGIASLIFVRDRGRRLGATETVETGSVGRARSDHSRGAAELAVARTFATLERDAWLVAGRTLAPERRSIIFEVVTRLVFHSMVVVSVYLLFAGHNLPGGGFAGGLLAGLALAVRYLAGGRFELNEAAPVSPGILLGIGLATAALSGAVPLALGGQVFQSAIIELWLPVFGDVKFVTSTIFDAGVYLVVVGLVADVLRSLGARIDEHVEEAEAAVKPAPARQKDDGGARADVRGTEEPSDDELREEEAVR